MSDYSEQDGRACADIHHRAFADLVEVYEPRLKSMRFENGHFELEIAPDIALEVLSELCVKALGDAPNFKTAEVLIRRSGEAFNVTVDRQGGKSLVQTLRELRARVALLEEVVSDVRELASGCAEKSASIPENAERDAGYCDVGRAALKILERIS